MKTFKHKKTGEIATYKDGVFKQGRFCVEIGTEPSKEFWEEIIEIKPLYFINSFISNRNIINIPEGTIVIKDKNNNFISHPHTYFQVLSTEKELLNNHDWSIYSIIRISDGEIFTLGDKTNKGIINSINIDNRFSNHNKHIISLMINSTTGYRLDELKKLKLLFTTEDGIDIFEGDEYYPIHKGSYQKGNKSIARKTYEDSNYSNNDWILFGKKENADMYLILNKPCLSLNDIWDISNNKSSDDNYVIIDKRKLKDLVKSKL
jgi:hypothetical protein